MESITVERLDHHGLVSGIVDELKLVEIIDTRIDADDQSVIRTGEAVKAMTLNGLGFSNRPLMLTPQFYENIPVEVLFRDSVKAAHFNRHKLGRVLDAIYDYGGMVCSVKLPWRRANRKVLTFATTRSTALVFH